ncbi:hypothetical protein CoHVHLJ_078 [Columbid alphaherpesvirus 1]|uniref:Uncharacterized protein n=1 Tax=Columbid alphaherpesvirus 1 TaxID=93386 RepID=A0A1V0M8L0_9ALPH|nr:hypothetical protein CoHVHLJ_078 [Columbid alphaherpesvirus 1]ARD71389.1 hypothetical protein CoHVHLJ_078 [Columbid alphaherpesvirus 1]
MTAARYVDGDDYTSSEDEEAETIEMVEMTNRSSRISPPGEMRRYTDRPPSYEEAIADAARRNTMRYTDRPPGYDDDPEAMHDVSLESEDELEDLHPRLPSYNAVSGPPPDYSSLPPPYNDSDLPESHEESQVPEYNTFHSDGAGFLLMTFTYFLLIGALLFIMTHSKSVKNKVEI